MVLSVGPLRRAGRRVPAIDLRPYQRQDVPATKSNPNQQSKCGAKEAAKARFDHFRKNCNLLQANQHNPTVQAFHNPGKHSQCEVGSRLW